MAGKSKGSRRIWRDKDDAPELTAKWVALTTTALTAMALLVPVRLLTAVSAIIYLIQERELKRKTPRTHWWPWMSSSSS